MDETGLMRPGPTRRRAEEEEEERKKRGLRGFARAVSEPLSWSPDPIVGPLAGAAYEVADKGWGTGIFSTLANLAMGAATRNGPAKVEALGRASKAAPAVLSRITARLARGDSPSEVYSAENALPQVGRPRDGVLDAAVPLMPSGAPYSHTFTNDFVRLLGDPNRTKNITLPYGEIFHPQATDQLAKTPYSGLLNVPVTVKVSDPHGSGFYDSTGVTGGGKEKIEINSRSLAGGRSVRALLAHEGTHRNQTHDYDQSGAHYEAGQEGINTLLNGAELFAQTTPNPYSRALVNGVMDGSIKLHPGTLQIPPAFQGKIDGEGQFYAQAAAWAKRVIEDPKQRPSTNPANQMPENLYRLYRSFHGEQNAEGGRQAMAGEPVRYTTPLSKQLFSMQELENPKKYARRLQELYDLKMFGQFDPKEDPYTLQIVKALQFVQPERYHVNLP